MRSIDLEKYIEQLKQKGVETEEVESSLRKIISSNASTQLPKAE